MADQDSKCCITCGQCLPLASYRKNHKTTTGYTRACKACLLAKDHARWEAMPPDIRAATKERYREGRRQYKIKNAALVKARKAAYFQRNRERLMAKTAEQRRANPERLRELARGWQARRREFAKGGATATETAGWAKAQKKVCYWCGAKCAQNYHIDHYVPLSKGGKHAISNLVIACPSCNLVKNAKDPLVFAREVGRLL